MNFKDKYRKLVEIVLAKKLRKIRTSVLEETIQYYSEDVDGRAARADNGRCRYAGKSVDRPNSDGCAVGRLLSPELRLELDEKCAGCIVNSDEVWPRLPKNVRFYGKGFLRELQKLHDTPAYWNSHGLSTSGIKKVLEIKESYNLK